MKSRRLSAAIISGAILGIFCIIGISLRMGFIGNELFILATWVNRVLMGLVIGLAASIKIRNIWFRGALLGFFVSGSFYLATSFKDTPGFIAGIVYGIIIDHIATKYEK